MYHKASVSFRECNKFVKTIPVLVLLLKENNSSIIYLTYFITYFTCVILCFIYLPVSKYWKH